MRYVLGACCALLAGCVDFSALSFDLGPVEHVDVFPAEATLRVGDSTHMDAAGYNHNGFLTHFGAARVWRISDTSLASLRVMGSAGDSVVVVARAPGVVIVEARIEGVLGTSTVTIDQ